MYLFIQFIEPNLKGITLYNICVIKQSKKYKN